MHPDVAGADPVKARRLQDEFQALQAEYQRLLSKCKTDATREKLKAGWLAMGGLAMGVALSPMAAVGTAMAAAAVAVTSAARKVSPGIAPATSPVGTSGTGLGGVAALEGLSLKQLYHRLDEAVEIEDYEQGAAVKARIDEIGRSGGSGI